MNVIDSVVSANEGYSREFRHGGLAMPPSRRLAILACMDARLSVERLLGLKTGEAHVIRNAGGLATEDALRSLIISHQLLGTTEFMIINHTDCGMLTFTDDELRESLKTRFGQTAPTPRRFLAFRDLDENVRQQVDKVRSHPWIPKEIPIRGFVYDVKTGRLREVVATPAVA